MTTGQILEKIISIARTDSDVREALITATRSATPATEIARICTGLGYPLSAMDIVSIGEEMYSTMKRSTNGGGANSPILEGADDFYEIFLSELGEL